MPDLQNGKSLESWIWDGACSIRGAKDAPKDKDYILPLQPDDPEQSEIATCVKSLAYSKKLPVPRLVYVVDFFCGCGGMSLGFLNTRQSHLAFKVLGGVDIDSHALKTYARNISGSRAIKQDIRTLAANPETLPELLGVQELKDLRPLVFIGCPPCQGFSAHRKKDDRDDPRNDLAVAFAKVCAYFSPDALVIENVPEILNGRFAEYFDKSAAILRTSGYHLESSVLDLSRYGVPQRRRRAVILGALKGKIPLPKALFSEKDVITVRQAIEHLPKLASGEVDQRDSSHRAPAHVDRILKMIGNIPHDGGGRRSLPAHMHLKCHTAVDSGTTPGFTDVYGRLRWDAPAVTITAKSSTPSCGRFLHPEQDRNITAREAAILQGFPQEFIFEGPFVNQYRQIGEAVPPIFSRSLAWQVLDHFCPRVINAETSSHKKRKLADNGMHLGVIDAFCGAGGLSLGFHDAGFKNLFAFDLNKEAVDTFNQNIGQHAEVSDICTQQTLRKVAEVIRVELPFVLVGGPPCQGFSQQRRGEAVDERNNLVTRFASMVSELAPKPAAVVLENVTYLDSPRGAAIFRGYAEQLEKLGFVIFRHDLNSAEFGLPQLRRRIIVVAMQAKYAAHYGGPIPTTPSRWPTVGEVLQDLPHPGNLASIGIANHEASREGVVNRRRIMFVDMGRGRLSIPDELQLACHRRYGGHLDVYGRLDWFAQARTITGGFDSYTRGEFAHPFCHRSITPREAARLQGFPDTFVFSGNRSAVRRQIGNAVPPPMARAIANAIKSAITK